MDQVPGEDRRGVELSGEPRWALVFPAVGKRRRPVGQTLAHWESQQLLHGPNMIGEASRHRRGVG